MADVSPTGSPGGVPYKAQYTVSPEFRKFWEKLFHNQQMSDQQVHQLTDQFVKNVSNQMNHVLQRALKEQKERHRREKEAERG